MGTLFISWAVFFGVSYLYMRHKQEQARAITRQQKIDARLAALCGK